MRETRPGAEPIVVERRLPASPEEVFEAWSDPQALSIWMCPAEGMEPAEVELDFRVGGHFRIAMKGEREFVQRGEYLEIDPPKRLVFTWVSEWFPEDEAHTRVSLSFEPTDDGATRLRLVHDALPPGEGYEGHRGGWTRILDLCQAHFRET